MRLPTLAQSLTVPAAGASRSWHHPASPPHCLGGSRVGRARGRKQSGALNSQSRRAHGFPQRSPRRPWAVASWCSTLKTRLGSWSRKAYLAALTENNLRDARRGAGMLCDPFARAALLPRSFERQSGMSWDPISLAFIWVLAADARYHISSNEEHVRSGIKSAARRRSFGRARA